MTLESRSFANTRPPHVSFFSIYFCPTALLKWLTLVVASTIACCVGELLYITSKSSDEDKENVF